MSAIYKITNKINSKSYIGYTKHNALDRWKRHQLIARGKHKGCYYALHAALEKYGIDQFEFEVLEENVSSDREIKLIAEYNTLIPNGYNIQIGGVGNKESSRRKEVDVYSLDKQYLFTVDSFAECAKILHACNGSVIRKACENAIKKSASRVGQFLVCYKHHQPVVKDTSYVWKATAASRLVTKGKKRPNHSIIMKQKMKERISELRKYEPVLNWVHREKGSFQGTCYDLKDQFPEDNIKISEIHHVIDKKRGYNQHRGWSIGT